MDRNISKYEKTRIIGARATQLSRGAEPTVDTKGMTNILDIATKEFQLGTIPLCVVRNLPNGDKVRVKFVPN